MATASMSLRSIQASNLSRRARIELTFQVAMRSGFGLVPKPGTVPDVPDDCSASVTDYPTTGTDGGPGTKNGRVHPGWESPSIDARHTSVSLGGSGKPVLK